MKTKKNKAAAALGKLGHAAQIKKHAGKHAAWGKLGGRPPKHKARGAYEATVTIRMAFSTPLLREDALRKLGIAWKALQIVEYRKSALTTINPPTVSLTGPKA